VAPGGSTGQIQYNNAGVFGGASGFSWSGTLLTLPNSNFPSAGVLSWNADTGLSRGGAGVLDVGTGAAGNAGGTLNGAGYQVAGVQVVGAQVAGYGTPTGGSRISSLPAGTVAVATLAASVAQLILDLKAHGLLGA
jgi:hypothetical protein